MCFLAIQGQQIFFADRRIILSIRIESMKCGWLSISSTLHKFQAAVSQREFFFQTHAKCNIATYFTRFIDKVGSFFGYLWSLSAWRVGKINFKPFLLWCGEFFTRFMKLFLSSFKLMHHVHASHQQYSVTSLLIWQSVNSTGRIQNRKSLKQQVIAGTLEGIEEDFLALPGEHGVQMEVMNRLHLEPAISSLTNTTRL